MGPARVSRCPLSAITLSEASLQNINSQQFRTADRGAGGIAAFIEQPPTRPSRDESCSDT